MPALAAVRASNAEYAPSYVPTIVIVGGTLGIGRETAKAFAQQTKGRANIILVGRNKANADETIASFPPPQDGAKYEFVSCDASLMKGIHSACAEIKKKVETVNYLILSMGSPPYYSRRETEEGNDIILSLRYYGRVKFVLELLPLLQRAHAAGQDARAMTIQGAGSKREVNPEDPGLKNWSLVNAILVTQVYSDIMVKTLGEQYPDIAFLHTTPGFVDTPGSRFNTLMKIIIPILKPFGVAITAEVAAQFMLYALLRPEHAKGAHYFDQHDEPLTFPSNVSDDAAKKIWEHTLEVVNTD